MTFVQNQEITVHENVGILLNWLQISYNGLSHDVLGLAGVNLFISCSLLDINVLLWIFIVRLGDILTVVIVLYFGM